jgi:NADH-quinone oxidoreductase subunit M
VNELHGPWLELSILIPLIGAAVVRRFVDRYQAWKWSLFFSGLTFLSCAAAWQDFGLMAHAVQADDRWHLMSRLLGLESEVFVIDHLNAPLLPMMSLLYFLANLATLRTKIRRFSFAWALLAESLVLAAFSCKTPWVLIGLVALGTIPPFWDLRSRGRPTRAFELHMVAYIGLLVIGQAWVQFEGPGPHSLWAITPLILAVFIRSGIAPLHCWMTQLYENASLGTALLFTMPLTGAYLAVRLVLPVAPDSVLRLIGLISLVTAVYAAGMALVQRDGRRFFCYLLISHSALVLVGLEIVSEVGLTGALCVWLSATVSLGGFGLTLRALEARRGQLSLDEFQGLYEHMPALAVCFFLTGLGSIGFPGTFGFIGSELLVDGAVEVYRVYVGIAVVIAAALNGIAFVKTYFLLFTGTRYSSSISLNIGGRERVAVLTLTSLIILGGVAPQFNVASRHQAAKEILDARAAIAGGDGAPAHADAAVMAREDGGF